MNLPSSDESIGWERPEAGILEKGERDYGLERSKGVRDPLGRLPRPMASATAP